MTLNDNKPTPEALQEAIAAGLNCQHLDVQGDGTYFQALIVSSEFEGKRLITRHQLVYKALGDRMRSDVHAFSMKTLTPDEFEAQN